MTISFSDFISQMLSSPMLAITVVLTLGVILVNGWTDAPNAIATCVSTRCMRAQEAIIMAAIFNFLGVLVMTMINSRVAMTIYNMVDFGGNTPEATVALCAAPFCHCGMGDPPLGPLATPTSAKPALIAGLSGAAIGLHGSLGGINFAEWVKVLYGLVLSTCLGFGSGFLLTRVVEGICSRMDRARTRGFFQGAQIVGGAGMAFMHGAQDGQKFMGVFLLGIFLVQGQNVSEFAIPVWLMILCSVVMGLGTSIGGYRIIKSVGMDMVKLQPYQGFAADGAATLCLLLSSLTGIPVSTTHTKTTAIMGVGASKRISAVNWKIVGDMTLAWVLTFPGCGLLGYLMSKLFIAIF